MYIWCNTFILLAGVKKILNLENSCLRLGRIQTWIHFLKENLTKHGVSWDLTACSFCLSYSVLFYFLLHPYWISWVKTNWNTGKLFFFFLCFYRTCHSSWNFINTAERKAGQRNVCLSYTTTFTEMKSFCKICCCYLLSFFAYHRNW